MGEKYQKNRNCSGTKFTVRMVTVFRKFKVGTVTEKKIQKFTKLGNLK